MILRHRERSFDGSLNTVRRWFCSGLVKAPKVYIRDTGLLHNLLGISTHQELIRHPKLGASLPL